MRLRDDAKGLAVEITLPETSWAKDAWASIKRGDVSGMSIGFRLLPNGFRWTEENGVTVRELLNVTLIEVSPVAIPAYAETSVSARSRMVADARGGVTSLYEKRLRLLDLEARAAGVDIG